MPTTHHMRAIFSEAAARLTAEQVALFESVTASPLQKLVDRVNLLSHETLSRVLDLGGGELGNVHPHPLNAEGLHVLKWLLARSIVDERRIANGWASHAEHKTFTRNGLLVQKLHHWSDSATRVPLTTDEIELIALASGWAQWPFRCSSHGNATEAARNPTAKHRESGMAVIGSHEHTFTDTDDQYQLHVDVYMPNIKFMVFTESTMISTGPFHFVLGSHAVSKAKARWLFERTRHMTQRGQTGGAFRHVNISDRSASGGWCHSSHACLEAAYGWQQRDLADTYGFPMAMPLLVEAGTLVIADTSAFHFRGLGAAGSRRARMGNLFFRCGRTAKRLGHLASVPRVPAIACSNRSAIVGGCARLHH